MTLEQIAIACLGVLSITGWYMFIRISRESFKLNHKHHELIKELGRTKALLRFHKERLERHRKPIPQVKTPKMRAALEAALGRVGLSKREIQDEYERASVGKCEDIWD